MTPAIGETGRGSPTGGVVYDHYMFPTRYHGAMFLADWSEGRILAVKTKRRGASYTVSSEVFLAGQPLPRTTVGWKGFINDPRMDETFARQRSALSSSKTACRARRPRRK